MQQGVDRLFPRMMPHQIACLRCSGSCPLWGLLCFVVWWCWWVVQSATRQLAAHCGLHNVCFVKPELLSWLPVPQVIRCRGVGRCVCWRVGCEWCVTAVVGDALASGHVGVSCCFPGDSRCSLAAGALCLSVSTLYGMLPAPQETCLVVAQSLLGQSLVGSGEDCSIACTLITLGLSPCSSLAEHSVPGLVAASHL